MPNDTLDNFKTDKKNALLAHKEKLLQEIKYYEQRIASANTSSSNIFFTSAYSSDSEDDLPTIVNGPSVVELKTQQKMLQTCLQATLELTNVQVLQSQVDVMVEDPVLDTEAPIKEPGLWREVTAECRIDLVPFAISFYVHKPSRKFGALSYRSLRVLPVKNAHEVELSKSVLPRVTTPSEAVEVLRIYAIENRSRRTTLAKLVDKFAGNLFMEPLAEGGYRLKCADLLEMSWRLENKLSPVASFHHRMKFDLEYMDESYIKTITHAHKQLSDPTITTDDRTELLAIIINTCIEAKGPTQELYESMESEPETVETLKKRRTTLDQEEKALAPNKKKDNTDKPNDEQIMAPPKSIPKKTKTKNKDNMSANRKSVKRSNLDEDDNNVKKAKIDDGPSMLDRVEAISTQIAKTNTDKNKPVSKNEAKNATTNSEKNKPAPNKKKVHSKNDGDKVATENNKTKQVLHSKDEGKEAENTENAKVAKTIKTKLNNTKIVKSTKDLNKVKSNDGKGQKVSEVAQKASKNKPQEPNNENVISKNTKTKQVDAVKVSEKEPVQVSGKDKKVSSSKNVAKAKDSITENASKDKNTKDGDTNKKDTLKNPAITKDQTAPTQKLLGKESHFKASAKNSANIKKSDKTNNKPQNATKNNTDKGQIPEKTNKEIKASSKDDVIHKTVSVNKAQNTDSINKASTKTLIIEIPIKDRIASAKISQNSYDPNKVDNNKKIIASKNDVITDNNKKITNDKPNINIKNNVKKTAPEKEIKSIEKIIKKDSNTAKAQIKTDNKNAKIPNSKSVIKEINTKTKTSKDIPDNSNKNEAQNKKPTNEINTDKSQKKNTENIKQSAQKISEHTQKETIVNTKKSLSKNTVTKNKENNPMQENEKAADRTFTKNDEVRPKTTQEKEKNKMSLKKIFHHNHSRKSISKKSSGNIVAGHLKSGNTIQSGIVKNTSKIPLINSSPISFKNLLRLPIRMSPRNLHSTLKSTSDSHIKPKKLKPDTNIPRWTKKAEINQK